MPNRNRNRNRNNVGSVILLDDNMAMMEVDQWPTRDPIRITKDFLKNNYFDMLKEKRETIECSICLEEIDCKNCFCLLTCGHSYHLACILKCHNCPICRG